MCHYWSGANVPPHTTVRTALHSMYSAACTDSMPCYSCQQHRNSEVHVFARNSTALTDWLASKPNNSTNNTRTKPHSSIEHADLAHTARQVPQHRQGVNQCLPVTCRDKLCTACPSCTAAVRYTYISAGHELTDHASGAVQAAHLSIGARSGLGSRARCCSARVSSRTDRAPRRAHFAVTIPGGRARRKHQQGAGLAPCRNDSCPPGCQCLDTANKTLVDPSDHMLTSFVVIRESFVNEPGR